MKLNVLPGTFAMGLRFYAAILLLLIGLNPLVIWPFSWVHQASEAVQWFGVSTFFDLFWFQKVFLLAGVALASLPYLFFNVKRWSWVLWLPFVWILGVIVAIYQAPFPMFLWSGIPDGNDTLFYWLALPTLLAFVIVALQDAVLLRWSRVIVFLVCAVLSLLTIGEIRQLYLMDMSWLQHLWFGGDLAKGAVIVRRMNSAGVFLTLANSNYAGSMGTLLVPCLSFTAVAADGLKKRLAFGLLSLGAVAIAVFSASRGAWIACLFTYGVMVACHWRWWRRYVVHAALVAMSIWAGSLFNLLGGASLGRAASIADEMLLRNNQVGQKDLAQLLVQVAGKTLQLSLGQQSLVFTVAERALQMTTGLGVPVPFAPAKDKKFRVELPEWVHTTWEWLVADGEVYLWLYYQGETEPSERFRFNGAQWFVWMRNQWSAPTTVPTIDIPGLESAQLSHRVYLWETSLPIVADHWLWGIGAGQYASVFPQHDFTGKVVHFNNRTILIDKPHQGYLDLWFASGLLGVVSFILLHVLGMPRPGQNATWRDAARFSVLAYAIVLLVNDHVVQVAGVWLLLLGAALSRPQAEPAA